MKLRNAAAALVLGLPASLVGDSSATTSQAVSIRTVAGTGVAGRSGDGGPAVAATVNHPRGIAFLRDGSFVFAEPFNNTVRRVSPDGTISTPVGTGVGGFSGDGGSATLAQLNFVHGAAAMPDGGYVLADMLNNRIRRVWPNATITTVAGNGLETFSGDGGPAVQAALRLPRGIAAFPDGALLIPDSSNHRVRRVELNGTITTVAGTGEAGFSGDGGPARAARLNLPFSVFPLPGGGFLIAEQRGQRIRRVGRDGTITTVAGTGTAGFSGDGRPATAAMLNRPHAVASLPDGGFLIADTSNNRVRRVRADGTITTIVGGGAAGFGGDGGPPAAALLDQPKALAVLPNLRGFLVADALNHRVRLVSIDLRPALVVRLVPRAARVPATRNPRLVVTLSRAAQVSWIVLRQGRIAARGDRRASTGRNELELRRLQPALYAVRITARAADGRRATARGSLRIVAG
ncbi:MAG: hypothetical protein M3540_04730 [Actinomycetota bacterium]|nr:hypothetical protein [Actinomycetota bacterium]